MAKVKFPSLVAAFLLSPLVACSTDTTAATSVVATSVGVDPLDFLGTVPCTGQSGSARDYVVTITDDTTGLVLAPSRPISCAVPVAFENVVVGHTYSAEIQVFDADPASGAAARWTTTCGSGGVGAAEVFTDQRTFIKNCIPLTGSGVGTTSVSVDASALAASLGCSNDGGKGVEKLRVTSIGAGLAGQTIGCGQPPVVADTDIVPAKLYTFRVEALEAGATTPRWAASCSATAKEGIQVAASCEALSDVGFIRIDIAKVVADAGLVCAASGPDAVGSYDVTFDDPPSSVKASTISCKNEAVLGPFERGSHAGEIFLRTSVGASKAHAICFASVAPNATATADCVPD